VIKEEWLQLCRGKVVVWMEFGRRVGAGGVNIR
jgi:hypothetical protein